MSANVDDLKKAFFALSKAERGFRMAVEGCNRFEEIYRGAFGMPSAWGLEEAKKAREMAERVRELTGKTLEFMGGGWTPPKRKGGAK